MLFGTVYEEILSKNVMKDEISQLIEQHSYVYMYLQNETDEYIFQLFLISQNFCKTFELLCCYLAELVHS